MRRKLTAEQKARRRTQSKEWRTRPSVVAYQKQYQRARRIRVRDEKRRVVEQIKSAPCLDCGGTFDPVCMDFDHRPGTSKIDSIAMMVVSGRVPMTTLLAEIAKCDVVCANCHRIRTHRLRSHDRTCNQPRATQQLPLTLGGDA